ncbi:MAG TPA: T9SS type A sorting domain-containing protein [Prolixibacteraceae bacterium]|nr:T9SS type A sorting domain-containing protein [Prolixibacteraceae bacterium]
MKTIFLYLLLCPVFLLAQSETRAVQLLWVDNINPNHEDTKQLLKLYAQSTEDLKTFNLADDNKELLDSTYQIYYYSPSHISRTVRKYYKYDDRGNQVLSVDYDGKHTSSTSFNSCEGCMGASFKTELKFDGGNHISERVAFICNPETKQWIKNRKSFYSYDINGRMTGYISYSLNYDNGLWTEPVKTDLSYNEHGDLTSFIAMMHDSTTDQWINGRKDECLYNNNLCIRRQVYIWNRQTSQWENGTKEDLEYDGNGNNTSRTAYNWDKQTSQWIGFFKYEYAYSSEAKLTNSTNSTWDKNTSQWINVNKTDYTFDINGNEIEELYSKWDTVAGKWIGRQKYESTYNDKGYLNSEITYLGWSKPDGTLDISSKDDYEYDSNGNNTSITSYYWNLSENAWSIRTKTNNYYSLHDLTNKVDIKENQKVRLYPNPVDETFTLEINDNLVTQCQLYNSNGQLLQTLRVERGINTYNIKHLKQGMYLLKIKTEEETVVKKVIKK